MSERLRKKIQEYLIRTDGNAKMKLCAAADISQSTLDNALGKRKKSKPPTADTVYRLALACGCSEEEALALASECTSMRVRETA
jgi:transcriptional regulator with XRE-family HTH domain